MAASRACRARQVAGPFAHPVIVGAVTTSEITVATAADRGQVVESLVAAFVKDPVLRYLFPDDGTYPQYAAAFFGHLFDKRVDRGTVWTIGNGLAVAMWDGPGPDDVTPRRSLADQLPADAMARVNAYDEAVHGALPKAPFWYLGVLGTHPDHTGRRWGHTLMATGLRRAAADGVPAVLETSNPGNVEVYRRAGWDVVVAVPAEPLPIWVMQQHPDG